MEHKCHTGPVSFEFILLEKLPLYLFEIFIVLYKSEFFFNCMCI